MVNQNANPDSMKMHYEHKLKSETLYPQIQPHLADSILLINKMTTFQTKHSPSH